MRIAWTLGTTTSNQVIRILNQKGIDWKPATVKTLLRRLVDKGALSATRHGRAFIYAPLVAEQATMDQVAQELFASICERRVGTTLADVIDQATLSKTDIDNLMDCLAKKRGAAPDEVECNCVPGHPMNC